MLEYLESMAEYASRSLERKDPLLHRALGGSSYNKGSLSSSNPAPTKNKKDKVATTTNGDVTSSNPDPFNDDEENGELLPQEQQNVNIDKLATKRRVKKRDKLQRNALHVACMNPPSLDVIVRLVELYPNAVSEYDKVGRLPLHLACSHNASLDVIGYLVECYPDGVMELTDRGISPLLCALENKASIDVVEYLLEKDPDVMKLETYKLGRTPLHVAAGRGASMDVIQLLIRLRPEAVHEKDAWGKTPFACACAATTSDSNDDENREYMFQLLHLLKDNTTISDPDRSGMLPLHIACCSGMNVDHIRYLLNEYPDAIGTPDNNGRLPFHAACTKPSISIEVLDMLTNAFPEALRTFDRQGALPLHIALQRKLPTDTIMFLIDKEIGAVRSREASTQMYPLHIAAASGADTAVLERIVEIYPKAVDSVDSKGNTIFHVACTFRRLTVDFAEFLLDRCDPDTVRKVNQEQCLPLHIAVQHRASWDVLELLIQLYPEALLYKDKKDNIPLHKAFETNTDIYVLVRMAQQNRHQLRKKNKRGCTPLQCASPEVQKSFTKARYWYNVRKAYCPVCIRK